MANKNKKVVHKSVHIALRITPKMKYALEILARKHCKNMSNIIEYSMQKFIDGENKVLSGIVEELWDVEIEDRLFKLGRLAPDLMSQEEQKIYKLLIKKQYEKLFNEE